MSVFILGPCSAESEDLFKSTGRFLHEVMGSRDWYYKASFEKANRTSLSAPTGPGLETALRWFRELKHEIPSIKLTTDVHEVHQIEQLADLIDCVQIPAFLCRQTALLVEAGRHFPRVNVKKGQWVAPKQAGRFVEKVKCHNPNAEVWITERGTFFGYDRLVVDFAGVEILKESFDKVILDCTHSTQKAKGEFTGGDRELAERFMLAAQIFDYEGIFAEVHPRPDEAISDADCQIQLDRFPRLLERHEQIAAACKST